MRQLTEEESQAVFAKLAKFLEGNLIHLVDNKENPHVFRLHKDRVYYASAKLVKLSGGIPKKNLVSIGTCVGKFSKTKKFRVRITFLKILARHANYKIWLKNSAEQSFLYGNHIVKRHIGRVTENTPEHAQVIVYTNTEIPIGFGVMNKSSIDLRNVDNEAIAVFHQADAGEYLRDEVDLI